MIQKRESLAGRGAVRPGPLDRGRRRQLSGSAKTEREAIALERRLILQVEADNVASITLSELVAESWASRPRLAATTKVTYRDQLDNHILPVLGPKKVREIRPRLIATFLRDLAERKQFAPATTRKTRTVLSAVMSYAAAMESEDDDPYCWSGHPKPGEGRTSPDVPSGMAHAGGFAGKAPHRSLERGGAKVGSRDCGSDAAGGRGGRRRGRASGPGP